MLIPTKRSGDLIIWHYLYKKNGSHISYLDNNTIPHVENVSDFDLEKARHVVGGCSEISEPLPDEDELQKPHASTTCTFVIRKLLFCF